MSPDTGSLAKLKKIYLAETSSVSFMSIHEAKAVFFLQPIKAPAALVCFTCKVSVTGLADFLRVQGWTEIVCPLLMIPLGWSTDRRLLPLLQYDRGMLKYFGKIFQLGKQFVAAAYNLCVLGDSLASPLQNTPQVPSQNDTLAPAFMGSRDVWLGLNAVPKLDWNDLLRAPILTPKSS